MNGNEKKLTLSVTEEAHGRVTEIADDLHISVAEYQRRLQGLGSVLHNLLEESSDGQVIMFIKTEGGDLERRHTVNDLMY